MSRVAPITVHCSNDQRRRITERADSEASSEPHSRPAPSPRPGTRPVLFVLTGPEQGAVFPLLGACTWLGRDEDVAVHLHDEAISQRHAHIERGLDGQCHVEDAGSRNGSYLNGERVLEPRRLVDGDHLRLGNTILRFSMLDDLEERALTNLYELTVRDPLTRTYNRRYLVTHLKSELAFAARRHMAVAVLLVDIDHFKRVNDSFGHPVGDVVLKLVADNIARLLRPYDVLCRFGGEEFVVVARDTSLRHAERLAERIRRQVERVRFEAGGEERSVSVSVGVTVAEPQDDGYDITTLLQTADTAMYEAKRSGRNRVHVLRSLPPPHAAAPAVSATEPPGPDPESRHAGSRGSPEAE